MTLIGVPDGRGVVRLTATFAIPPAADDAPPWTDEYEMAKPHEVQAGDDGTWVGEIRSSDRKVWAGEIRDCYGGLLSIEGAAQGNGVMSLRAKARIKEQTRD